MERVGDREVGALEVAQNFIRAAIDVLVAEILMPVYGKKLDAPLLGDGPDGFAFGLGETVAIAVDEGITFRCRYGLPRHLLDVGDENGVEMHVDAIDSKGLEDGP